MCSGNRRGILLSHSDQSSSRQVRHLAFSRARRFLQATYRLCVQPQSYLCAMSGNLSNAAAPFSCGLSEIWSRPLICFDASSTNWPAGDCCAHGIDRPRRRSTHPLLMTLQLEQLQCSRHSQGTDLDEARPAQPGLVDRPDEPSQILGRRIQQQEWSPLDSACAQASGASTAEGR